MEILILVLYGVLALVVVNIYSGVLLVVCAAALGYRKVRTFKNDRRRETGDREKRPGTGDVGPASVLGLRSPVNLSSRSSVSGLSVVPLHRWVDWVLWFLVARSALILIYGWVSGH